MEITYLQKEVLMSKNDARQVIFSRADDPTNQPTELL